MKTINYLARRSTFVSVFGGLGTRIYRILLRFKDRVGKCSKEANGLASQMNWLKRFRSTVGFTEFFQLVVRLEQFVTYCEAEKLPILSISAGTAKREELTVPFADTAAKYRRVIRDEVPCFVLLLSADLLECILVEGELGHMKRCDLFFKKDGV